ncbi:OLC1v1020388C1 [Oldenlandia corymbosa var. corymbosa]|uniref:OLC1v1020388C1 n=1 Tax=Oldenlandia corymbosa var. corymbosa TaxID=529605 RepID=A0AAV1EGV2_OLDCO|nr:OLC1v1020388C1 [Oldenlandia corymbosa var. corymbosa]
MVDLNNNDIMALHRNCPWLLLSDFPKSDGPVFAESLLRNLREFLEDNPTTETLLKDQAQVLLQELQILQSFMKDVKLKNINQSDENLGGSRILCLIFEVEYIITKLFEDECVPSWYKQLMLFDAVCKAKLIKSEIQEYHRHHNEAKPHGTNLNDVGQTLGASDNSRTDEVVVGFEDRAKDIEVQLKVGLPKRQILTIVRMGGVGKTTLAKKVYNSLSIPRHFSGRSWCTISQVYQRRELLLEILGCIAEVPKNIGRSDDDIANILRRSLKGRRYLVVLDDMWSTKAWEDLQISLPDDGKGSRILITSRNSEVALERQPYLLPFLTVEENWNLFQEKLFHGGSCPEELLEAGRLMRRCLEETAEEYLVELIGRNLVMETQSRSRGGSSSSYLESSSYRLYGSTVEWPNSKFLRVLDAEHLRLRNINFEKFELMRCIKYLALWGEFYSVPSSIVQLFNLETLILKQDTVETFLRRLIGIKKLKCQLKSDGHIDPEESHLFSAMGNLHQLESLHLSCYSIAHMIHFPSQLRFPINLKKLTLRRFRLPLKSVSAIGQQLRNLEVLKIIIWNASSDSFPQLERLVLQACRKLEEIPIDFGDISTLQKIEVKNCREWRKTKMIRVEASIYHPHMFDVLSDPLSLTWFVDTHLKLLRVFACYTGKWSDEDKDKYLVSLPTDHRELVAQINSNNFCDYVARFVFPKASVGFENEPKLRFKDSYVSLKFQADIATTLKYLLRSTHPPIGDVLVFSQFAASVHDYVASLWLEFQEYVECGMLTYSFIYSEVEGNYKAVARELGYLKSSISTLPDKEKFQDLLSRAGAVFLRAAIVACDNQFIDRDAWLFATDMALHSRKLISVVRNDGHQNHHEEVHDQAQVLLQELQYLQSFIKDVRKRRIDESEDLEVARMICLIYEAEYIIINLFEDAGVPVWYKHLVLLNAISEAKLIRSEIQKYHHRHKEKRDRGNIHNVARHTLEGVNDSRTNQVIVGFEDRARDIIDQLTTGSSRRQIVSIVGMGGIGKTTLAMKVYNNLSIQHHFRDRAWCTVSQVYNKRELLLEVLGCIAEITEQIKKMGDDDIANKLRQSLKGKRYLVVMDDMWSIEAWTDLQMSFPDDAKGSRILFTSRNSEMALERQPYHLPLLNAEESLNLFNEKLFHGGICPKELLGVGRFIVENCQGLPLAIVIMAGILEKVKKRKDCWAEIAEHLMSHIAHDGGDTRFVDILEFSYNHLPTHLKPCFLYLGMFREDQYIPVQKLKLMWIAEGFVPKKDSKSLEETAEEYLVELIARNLVMEAQKRSRGGAKTCHMHDMVHYLCLEKSREENFMQLITTRTDGGADLGDSCSSIVSSSYRTCFQLTLEQLRAQHQSLDPHVRSLLFFPTISNQDKFVSRPLQLQDAKFLRLLDMVYVQIVPLSLEEFIWMRCLKYLAVSGDFSSVPSSIVQLVDLETLILKGNAKTIDVSTKLWSMGKLRHVQVTFISHSSLPGPEIECQGNIVSLSWLTFGRSTSSRGETFLRRFTGIKKLKCQFQRERGSDPEEGYPIPAMDALYQLESLHLFRSPVSWRRSTVSFPGKFRFPANLKKLTLSSFDLSSRCISTIGQQLSNLEVLKLRKCYWMDSVWSVAEGEFLNLKYLQIYDFDIVIWNASADSFPLLERLVLLHCYHLQEIPSSFGEVPTLQVSQLVAIENAYFSSVCLILEKMLSRLLRLNYFGVICQKQTPRSSLQEFMNLVPLIYCCSKFPGPSAAAAKSHTNLLKLNIWFADSVRDYLVSLRLELEEHNKLSYFHGIDEQKRDYGKRMALCPPSRRPLTTSMITFEDLVESYANLYQMFSRDKSITTKPARSSLKDIALKFFRRELQVLHSFIKKIKQKNEYIITNLFEDGYFPTSERSNNQGPDEVIVGFEDQAKYIEDQLKASSPERQIISIVGMGGSGKTTLAKKVYNSLSIQRHFWVRAWCTVSQVYRKRELLLEILECVVEITEEIKRKDDDDVADTLRKKLKGKRYLVVIDDIWSKDAWNDLRLSLPNDAKGSRILFTSRNFEVALERELYRLPLLTVEESWLLFEEKLFHGGKCPKELLEVGRLIVENCKGLPLAIIVMAGLLEKVEKRKDRWEEIGRTSMSRTARDDGDNQIMHMLALSYNHLPSHLKPCFLYFGMFLEDQQVPVQKLKWLWIAEGFVPKEDSKSLEETAEEYLVELIGRNLVLEAQSRSRGGSKTCQVHDMVRYLCLKKAREENFMHRIMDADFRNPGSSCSYPVSSSYRLSFQPDLEWHWFQFIETRVRSLLVFPSHGYKLDGRTVEWPNSKFLRVLDAEQLQLSDIKFEKFELLRCIKYLAVRGSFYSVPSSIIVQLFNLETLILKGDPLGNHVSTELWRMRKLRHVHIKAISHSSLPGPHEIEDLGNIVTLSLLTIKDPSSVEKFLKSLIGVKKLKCQFIRDGDTDRKSCVTPAMDTLHQLVSLHLSCYSIAHMITFPSNFRFPINLKKLTLRRFRLPLKSVSAIGQQLRNLEVLKIMYCYEMDSTWDMEEDEFRKLTYLKICAFGFRIWNASSDSFPQLERLVLQDCPKLEEIPISFGDISSLQMIEVKNCRESACKSVEAIYKQQLDWGNEKFKVSITGMLDDEETSESEDDDDEYDGWLN